MLESSKSKKRANFGSRVDEHGSQLGDYGDDNATNITANKIGGRVCHNDVDSGDDSGQDVCINHVHVYCAKKTQDRDLH